MEKETRTLMVEVEIPIQAKREVVWDALVNDISLWWRKDFCATKLDKMVLEPRLGGRMYEDCGNGTGMNWYTVEMIKPNEALLMSGVMDHNWGGPCRTLLSLELEESGSGETKLKVVDSYIGHVSDKAAGSFEAGWMAIFGEAFKPYVEKKSAG